MRFRVLTTLILGGPLKVDLVLNVIRSIFGHNETRKGKTDAGSGLGMPENIK